MGVLFFNFFLFLKILALELRHAAQQQFWVLPASSHDCAVSIHVQKISP